MQQTLVTGEEKVVAFIGQMPEFLAEFDALVKKADSEDDTPASMYLQFQQGELSESWPQESSTFWKTTL